MPANIIEIRGARVHNLKNIDVDVPLDRIVGIAGVSGSGKSSLALGILYAEGSRRYLESLSAYTRRRMTQAAEADLDDIRHIPAALALHQRPGIPGVTSTFGTGTELLNSLRLMFSRLAEHRCPNGHYVAPSLNVAAECELECPVCGARFYGPSAEDLAFNSRGACRRCGGTGTVMSVDESTLVPDESMSIDDGAVSPWGSLMWSLMTDVCRAMGVRTDVPYRDLTPEEKDIVLHGPAVKKHILYKSKTSENAGEMDFTYYSAVRTVENALSKVKDEKGMKRVEKYLKSDVCPDCHGTRLSEAARAPRLAGMHLDEVCTMPLGMLLEWVDGVPDTVPESMRPMARSICGSFSCTASRLIDLGLSYLSLDRSASSLSTGERQRMQLARAVRNRTSGVLYVLDEPSIGLHPCNLEGLIGVIRDLRDDGNSVVLVDHDTAVLSISDWMIEMGPGSGASGGTVIAQGTIPDVIASPASRIGPFLAGNGSGRILDAVPANEIFSKGRIDISIGPVHTVKPLTASFPEGRMTVVTGVSGSGKTTLVLESLVPALQASVSGTGLPNHVASIRADGISRIRLMDASPIGINSRSTVATYTGIHDDLRRMFSKCPGATACGYKAGDFSYNTGRLRCPVCDGVGSIDLDVQFLPDIEIPCPQCRGSRYSKEASDILLDLKGDSVSLPRLMDMDVDSALELFDGGTVSRRLRILHDLGLGYLTLGEETPGLSGGEAQRIKLSAEMGRAQSDTVFVFDEPTIGLHPLDVKTLLCVFRTLLAAGATVVVIEHDLDVIRNADWIVDMGPGGGDSGGYIVAEGTLDDIKTNPRSVTGRYI